MAPPTRAHPLDKDETVESLTPASGIWSAYVGTLTRRCNSKRYGTAASSIKIFYRRKLCGVSLFTFNLTRQPQHYTLNLFWPCVMHNQLRRWLHRYSCMIRHGRGPVASFSITSVTVENEWTAFELQCWRSLMLQIGMLQAGFDWSTVMAVSVNRWLVSGHWFR